MYIGNLGALKIKLSDGKESPKYGDGYQIEKTLPIR